MEPYLHLSLSAEELALIFSMLNQPEMGKDVLAVLYGKMQRQDVQIALNAASHSLMARDLVSLSDENKVNLSADLVSVITPLIQFYNMLQVTINRVSDNAAPEITNIHLNDNGLFTTHRIDSGVVHHFIAGKISDLPNLIALWFGLPTALPVGLEAELASEMHSIPMSIFTSLLEGGNGGAGRTLHDSGLSPVSIEMLLSDTKKPILRGSIALIDIKSTSQKVNLDETGGGMLYLTGPNASWILAFDHASEDTIGTILPGTQTCMLTELQKILT